MAQIIKMPRLSDTMKEGNIVEWHVSEGDKIEAGDVLAEVETDKATMEIESYFDGTILHIEVEKGAVPVNAVIAVMGEEGEDYTDALKKAKSGSTSDDESGSEESEDSTEEKPEKKTEEKEEEAADSPEKAADSSEKDDTQSDKKEKSDSDKKHSTEENQSDARIKASPLAKSMAEEMGIDLTQVKGTGAGGRIVKRDIDNYKPSTSGAQDATLDDYTDIEVSQMRKTIARRLAESKFQAPHFYLTVDVDMDLVVATRKQLNRQLEKDGIKLSFNDFIMKATAMALKKHPEINASWQGDTIRQHHKVNLGVAVAVKEGLLVPVIKNAANLSMTEIAQQVNDYAEKARNKKLSLDEMQGNTFTVSNLGMFGIEEFTAIINPLDSCILAVGAINQVPVVKDGAVIPGHRMKMTLSCDHRVVDGAMGARFLQTLVRMIENPVAMLV